jgi:hypothetical protein
MVQTQDLGEISREAGDVLDEDQIERRRDLDGRGDESSVTRPMLDPKPESAASSNRATTVQPWRSANVSQSRI